ncbi:INO80 complex subunit 2 [Tolypocladium ophioglossoides CBS 100239]|uniref:INO80 complex subunit 2 n=1 Tax=Tolypocladium ophioglossoides (strain CBS 100239) TaxID=1163406 RepID=A0A0L0NF75_TOLOC|nr:INO80 complex subunit 2 [Tolypocladium ophioglossoides CBS 100239]
MSSRPRRSAATKASESISVHAKWADASDKSERNIMASRRSGRASGASAMRDAPSSPSDSHISVNVKTAASKSRQPTRVSGRRGEVFGGGEIVTGTRNRGGRKNYVIDSSPDDDDDEEEEEEEEEEEAEIDDAEDDDMDDLGDEDAEGEEMEVDAEGEDVDVEGEEDAEGDIDMDLPVRRTATTIRVSQPSLSRSAARAAASKIVADDEDDDDDDDDEEDDDDDDLSDPGESDDGGDQTLGFGDDTMADEEEADEDAVGEEIEVAGEEDAELDAEGEDAPGRVELNSDEDGSRAGTPDLTKMTKRQRARFEDEPQEYMKLSDEVQVKKHFTAEELSMRRQEMARRRRNLSEKRTEEVKMETINKLLKKQAPKISRKAVARGGSADEDELRANPIFVRWVSTKDGSQVSVPQEMLAGPAGWVFAKGRLAPGKMVQEVA